MKMFSTIVFCRAQMFNCVCLLLSLHVTCFLNFYCEVDFAEGLTRYCYFGFCFSLFPLRVDTSGVFKCYYLLPVAMFGGFALLLVLRAAMFRSLDCGLRFSCFVSLRALRALNFIDVYCWLRSPEV